jgi:2'-5' RNA ligase
MRAFVALELPAPAQRRLIATQRELARQLRLQQLDRCVRWTPASNLHLTLRFLGEIDDLQRRVLEDALATLVGKHSRLLLEAGGLGCFPNTRRPSVIWCGIQGDGTALARLQADIEHTARRIGLPAEEKAFAPHLTIGRLQRSATGRQLQAVGAAVLHLGATAVTPVEPATTPVGELLLMQSELTPTGAIYTPLGVFPLSASTTTHAP